MTAARYYPKNFIFIAFCKKFQRMNAFFVLYPHIFPGGFVYRAEFSNFYSSERKLNVRRMKSIVFKRKRSFVWSKKICENHYKIQNYKNGSRTESQRSVPKIIKKLLHFCPPLSLVLTVPDSWIYERKQNVAYYHSY